MPGLPRRISPWTILMPWKYDTRWARFVGFYCLITAILSITMQLFDVPSILYVPFLAGLLVVALGDMVRMFRDTRKFRKSMRTLRIWGRVIEGEVKIDDLPPDVQEDIAVQRAAVYVEKRDPLA